MAEEAPYDVEELRERFPWVGLGPAGETELSSRYREIMAETRISREIVAAVDEIRRPS